MKCEVFLEAYPERLAEVKLEYGECFWGVRRFWRLKEGLTDGGACL